MTLAILVKALAIAGLTQALNGGLSDHKPVVYTAYSGQSMASGYSNLTFSKVAYQYTGFGSAESNIDFASNGDWVQAPAFSTKGAGIAVSSDKGETWTQRIPEYNQPRPQIVFRNLDGRFYQWSSITPGYYFSRSEDDGLTWTLLDNGHFDPYCNDWAKMIAGPPATSQLSNGASQILYFSAPSNISTPLPVQPFGPIAQYFLKSTDHGVTFTPTKGNPSLQPGPSGGSCAGADPQELIIWGDGFVTKNGTVMFGLRRCQAVSIAVSDDEGDSWRFVDVPGSFLRSEAFLGILSYAYDGNILVPEPISQDAAGNIYAIWVDTSYAIQMAKSTDFLKTFSPPVVITAPGVKGYIPTLRHSSTVGRGALVYYGSTDFVTWDGYIAESVNLLSANPMFKSVIGNPSDQPLQRNIRNPANQIQTNKVDNFDSGYGDLYGDNLEFTDIRYEPGTNNLVASMTRKMCSSYNAPYNVFNQSSCYPGWSYTEHGNAVYQGIVLSVEH